MAPAASRHSSKDCIIARNGTRLLKPVIRLKSLEQKDEGKHAGKKIKCRTNPTDADSTTYEIPMSYFRDGTPKEWFLFKKKLKRCINGQNATTRQAKYALARRLLAGQALADFNHTTLIYRSEMAANYTRCIQAVTLCFFPQKGIQDQKRWMRRFLKKP